MSLKSEIKRVEIWRQLQESVPDMHWYVESETPNYTVSARGPGMPSVYVWKDTIRWEVIERAWNPEEEMTAEQIAESILNSFCSDLDDHYNALSKLWAKVQVSIEKMEEKQC